MPYIYIGTVCTYMNIFFVTEPNVGHVNIQIKVDHNKLTPIILCREFRLAALQSLLGGLPYIHHPTNYDDASDIEDIDDDPLPPQVKLGFALYGHMVHCVLIKKISYYKVVSRMKNRLKRPPMITQLAWGIILASKLAFRADIYIGHQFGCYRV